MLEQKQNNEKNADDTTSAQPIAKPNVGCSLSDVSENVSVGKKAKFISSFGVNIVNKETDEFFKGHPSVLSKEERDSITEILHKELSEDEYFKLRNIVSKLDSADLKIKTYGMYFMIAHEQS